MYLKTEEEKIISTFSREAIWLMFMLININRLENPTHQANYVLMLYSWSTIGDTTPLVTMHRATVNFVRAKLNCTPMGGCDFDYIQDQTMSSKTKNPRNLLTPRTSLDRDNSEQQKIWLKWRVASSASSLNQWKENYSNVMKIVKRICNLI